MSGTLSAAEVETRAHAHGRAFVGRAVRRKFATGWFSGTVTGVRVTCFGMATVWRVRYPDGDCEELAWLELRDALAAADAGADTGGAQAGEGRIAGGGARELVPLPPPPPAAPAAKPVAPLTATRTRSGASPRGASGGAVAAEPPQQHAEVASERAREEYNGVKRCKNITKGFCATVEVPLQDGSEKTKRFHGGVHPTAAAAAAAADALFREHGMLDLLNFPQTQDEHAAVAGAAAGPAAQEDAAAAERAAKPPARKRAAEQEPDASPPPPKRAPTSRKLPPAPRDDVAAFLRGIRPQLSCLDASLKVLPASGLTMELLRRVSPAEDSASPVAHLSRLSIVTAGLEIATPADKLKLALALDDLARSA